MPSWRLIARANVRSDGASRTVTPSTGRSSSHSAEEACRSASISSTGSYPLATAAAARYTDVVVFPTPPLTLETRTFIQPHMLRRAGSSLYRRRDAFLTTRPSLSRFAGGATPAVGARCHGLL